MDKAEIYNIEFDAIDYGDYPDFCDAYITKADYDGIPMTEEQIDEINEDRDFVHKRLMDFLH